MALHEDMHGCSATLTLPTALQRSCAIHKLHISTIKVLWFPNPFGHCTVIWSSTIKTDTVGDLKIAKTFEDTPLDNLVTSLLPGLSTCNYKDAYGFVGFKMKYCIQKYISVF